MERASELVIQAMQASGRDARIEAFGALVTQYKDMAYGYAYSILGDFHLAEDAAQDAFITAFERLGELRDPAAFAGWLRRIVWSSCNRLTRNKGLPMEAMAADAEPCAVSAEPGESLEQKEMRDEVLKAIRQLPVPEREVTSLFYINGYSQRDIAGFLEVPVSTVKNRLNSSRRRLKERMLGMVEETLHKNAPDERFDRKVIEELLSRPRPLEIPGHPVREIWEAIKELLGEYEVIEGSEVIGRDLQMEVSGGVGYALPDSDKVLRTSTTTAVIAAMAGRRPPVRLVTAGRVFRHDKGGGEDRRLLKVFHQCDVLRIEPGLTLETLKAEAYFVVRTLLGAPEKDIRWEKIAYPYWEQEHVMHVCLRGEWTSVAGCGMMSAEALAKAGYDPGKVAGYGFGLGLERIAMLKYGIDDIRKLWQEPYVR
jgi:RNA polymerase sigma factor (sigma-70 family)